ncbi:MAG: tectonin domain-containing protein, partial [bacterium]
MNYRAPIAYLCVLVLVFVGLAQSAYARTTVVWGVNANNQLYFRNGITKTNFTGTEWKQIADKAIKYVDVGPEGQVWAIGTDNAIYFREGITPLNPIGISWKKIDGGLNQISGSSKAVWGVNLNDDIYFREGITPENPTGTKWTKVPGLLKHISVNKNGVVWGVNKNDAIYIRKGITTENLVGTSWLQVPGGLMQICVGSKGDQTSVWGVNKAFYVYSRQGISTSKVEGTTWVQPWSYARAKHFEVDNEDGILWHVNSADNIYVMKEGGAWAHVPGKLKQISVGNIQEAAEYQQEKSAVEPKTEHATPEPVTPEPVTAEPATPVSADIEKLNKNIDILKETIKTYRAALEDRDIKIDAYKKEIEQLRAASPADVKQYVDQIESYKKMVESLTEQLKQAQQGVG